MPEGTTAPVASWGFRPAPADGGRDFGNANVWSFEPKIEVFVREVLQNALDAVARPGGTVDVAFRIVRLRGDDLRRYLDALRWEILQTHLKASTRNSQKLGALLADGLRHLDESEEMLLLIVDDAGTTGLIGAEKGSGKFAALCRNNLDSNKEGASTKGGAFGLGKGVLWRASRFATVVFCSDLTEPPPGSDHRELRLLGRCDLPWHEVDSTAYAGPSWFGRSNPSDPNAAVSFWGERDLAEELYVDRRDRGPGTSACVVGFHDPSADTDPSARDLAEQIETAAAQYFFPAITNGRLAVTVEAYDSRDSYRSQKPTHRNEVNVQERCPQYHDILLAYREEAVLTGEGAQDAKPGDVVMRSVLLEVPKLSKSGSRGYEHDAILLVRFAVEDGEEPLNRLAMFRGPGMVVEEKNLGGLCLGARPFHALLLCGAAAGDDEACEAAEEFLRTAEPPSHNKWDTTSELRAEYARGCVSRLSEFHARWKDTLREVVRTAGRDLGDGPQSLQDLFRLGNEPTKVTRDRPRIVPPVHGEVEDDQWVVQGRIRLKASKWPIRISPEVTFRAETGGGTAVKWQSLEGTRNCTADGADLIVPPGTREAKFTGRTDPASHPLPAAESCVSLDIRRSAVIRGEAAPARSEAVTESEVSG